MYFNIKLIPFNFIYFNSFTVFYLYEFQLRYWNVEYMSSIVPSDKFARKHHGKQHTYQGRILK